MPEQFNMSLSTIGRFGVIGVGNMGAAIIRGVAKKLLSSEQIFVTDVDPQKVDELRTELGVNAFDTVGQLVENVDTILYSAKPNNAAKIFKQARELVKPSQLLISIAAGIPIAQLESYFAESIPVIRVMPNIAVTVGSGVAAISPGSYADENHLAKSQAIFNAVGSSLIIEEKQLDAVTGLSGSGPAFVFVFIEALIDAGVHVGLSREDAHQLAVQTVLGAAKIIDQNREHPAVWKSRVTTPAGTTAAGLFELEQGKFRSIINAAVIAATERAQELAYA
ncbi:pyrroline-5-carboxylate reductase [Candidatus Poribacteria bacterium]|nr:pyrroline-5-carboxylate reductase [Candidatus Poribacteria bacterium]MBT19722.1 pyrroline-5-carboxylate reductase [Candidatus Poribacteria bacterium]|tara:strand:- start:808 stop:1644 length:837 start_codon:yes stop_codon:yes gene_type:complete